MKNVWNSIYEQFEQIYKNSKNLDFCYLNCGRRKIYLQLAVVQSGHQSALFCDKLMGQVYPLPCLKWSLSYAF